MQAGNVAGRLWDNGESIVKITITAAAISNKRNKE